MPTDEPGYKIYKSPEYHIMLPIDDDGTPIIGGERAVEVRPGVWAHPDTVALDQYLTEVVLPSLLLRAGEDSDDDPDPLVSPTG